MQKIANQTIAVMKMKNKILLLAATMLSLQLWAQTFNTLYCFTNSPDGANPLMGLLLAGGTFYGTTSSGGSAGSGTLFTINTNGTSYTVLKNFTNSPDGSHPRGNLVLIGNTLYGTTPNGGVSSAGTVFKINTNGTGFSVVKSFSSSAANSNGVLTNSDGITSDGGLVSDGSTLYGTTAQGGFSGSGVVFKLNTNGTGFTVLKAFSSVVSNTNSDGRLIRSGLVLGGNTLYGTAQGGGSSGSGTVFKINTDGTGFSTLKNFPVLANNVNLGVQTNIDGANPSSDLLLDGNILYGTCQAGGNSGRGTLFKIATNGTGFTVLKTFSQLVSNTNSDGASPIAALVLNGSLLFGTTAIGGSSSNGVLFEVKTDGTSFAAIKNFSGSVSNTNNDGVKPEGNLVLSGSTLYGLANSGGVFGNGTVFSLTLPLPILQVKNISNTFLVYWQDDGLSRILQTTTNLAEPTWISITPLNWTNNFANPQQIGYQITNSLNDSAAFFRLQ